MSAAIAIEHDVPLRTHKYPFREMQVGDSFFVPAVPIGKLAGSASYVQRQTGYKFRLRTVEGGVRVWRVQ